MACARGRPVTLIDIVRNLIRNGLDFVDGFDHFDEGVDHDLAIFSFQVVECRVREIGELMRLAAGHAAKGAAPAGH